MGRPQVTEARPQGDRCVYLHVMNRSGGRANGKMSLANACTCPAPPGDAWRCKRCHAEAQAARLPWPGDLQSSSSPIMTPHATTRIHRHHHAPTASHRSFCRPPSSILLPQRISAAHSGACLRMPVHAAHACACQHQMPHTSRHKPAWEAAKASRGEELQNLPPIKWRASPPGARTRYVLRPPLLPAYPCLSLKLAARPRMAMHGHAWPCTDTQ